MTRPPSDLAQHPRSVEAPLVSVIIPAYKVAAYIHETLDAIFAQTFSDYEVVIVNDGSPDTAQLEAALEPYRSRIVYFRQENQGAAEARNVALRAARGELVAFLDADDLWLPHYLAEQVAFLRDNPSYDLVYADAEMFGDPAFEGRRYMEFARSEGEVTFESLLRAECNLITSGVVARRQIILDVGLFDRAIRRGHDFDLWLRLVRMGARLTYQRKVLLRRRMHDESLSGDSLGQKEREVAVLERFSNRGDLTAREGAVLNTVLAGLRADVCVERAKRLLARGDYAAASQQFKDANNLRKNWKLRLVRLCLWVAPRALRAAQRWRTAA